MARLPTALLALSFSLTQLVVICLAQGSSASQSLSPSATTSSVQQTHTINVGDGGNKFNPPITQAAVGDLIEFDFFPPNHSVVRAEYKFPCIPYEDTGTDKVGFFSGFYPVDVILSNPPKWTVLVNDSYPIFFYCSAPGSCINFGMVGVINPNATTSYQVQYTMALAATYMLQPGEPFPAEASSSSSASSSTSTSSSTSSTTTTSTTAVAATATAAASSHSTMSSGAIAGIAVGAGAVLTLAAALFFYIGRSKTLQSEMQRATTTTQHLPPPSHGMYQSPSGQIFVPMKIDDSVRNSTIPYDIAPSQMYGRDTLRPEGGVSAEEAHSLRSTNESPGTSGGAWAGIPLGPYGQQYAAANPQAPTRNPGNVSPRLPVVPPAPVTQYYDSAAKPPLGANMNDTHEMDATLPPHIMNDIRGQIN
jgi:plastocyanin